MKRLKCFTKPKNRKGYYFTPTVDGKTKWIALGEDYQAALEKYHLLIAGVDAHHRPHTINEGIDLYISDGAGIEEVHFKRTTMRPYSSLSEATERNYTSVIKRIRKEFGSRDIDTLKAGEVTRWVVKHSDGNLAISILNNVYAMAKYAGWVDLNPLTGQVERLPQYKRTKHVKTAELLKVREHTNDAVRLYIDIAMRTGLRKADVLALRPEMIEGDRLVTAISKGAQRGQTLSFKLDDGLRELVMQTPIMGPSCASNGWKRATPLNVGTLGNWWRRACRAAGVTDLRPHDCRRWVIQQADRQRKGKGREIADHASDAQTATYLAGAPKYVDAMNVTEIVADANQRGVMQ
jgi:integrase